MEDTLKDLREDRTLGGTLYTHLRHRLKHRKKPASGKHVVIKDKIGIELRPDIVKKKERLGDWEIDTIVGKGNKGAILTIVELKTGFLIAEKLDRGKTPRLWPKHWSDSSLLLRRTYTP